MDDVKVLEALDLLATKVRRLEDLDEIRRLYVDYGRHLDDGDTAAYAQLFATNAKLRLGPVMRADGREAIQEAAARTIGARDDASRRSAHLIDSPRLTLEGDAASGECVWAAISHTDSGDTRVIVGRHIDKLVREDGRWCFAERRGTLDIGSLA
jgi:uncharacterized protein (TIGR02246 family)